MTKLKVRVRRTPDGNIRATFFLGADGQTLQNAGSLIMRIGEYQIIFAALGTGLKQPGWAQHLTLELEGEDEALNPGMGVPQ